MIIRTGLKIFPEKILKLIPSAAENPVDKKLARQQSAESRKKLAPLNKKQLRRSKPKLKKNKHQLQKIETQLADADLYNDSHKNKLKTCLSEQAISKKNLSCIGGETGWKPRSKLSL
jgi:hypothetical protein